MASEESGTWRCAFLWLQEIARSGTLVCRSLAANESCCRVDQTDDRTGDERAAGASRVFRGCLSAFRTLSASEGRCQSKATHSCLLCVFALRVLCLFVVSSVLRVVSVFWENSHTSFSCMKHIHTRFLFIQDLVFRILLTTSATQTDVNPSDIGTTALGREGFSR